MFSHLSKVFGQFFHETHLHIEIEREFGILMSRVHGSPYKKVHVRCLLEEKLADTAGSILSKAPDII